MSCDHAGTVLRQGGSDAGQEALAVGTAEELTRRVSALLDQRGGPPNAAAELQPVLAALAQQAELLHAEVHRLPVWQMAGVLFSRLLLRIVSTCLRVLFGYAILLSCVSAGAPVDASMMFHALSLPSSDLLPTLALARAPVSVLHEVPAAVG